jgi:hypothetical protein
MTSGSGQIGRIVALICHFPNTYSFASHILANDKCITLTYMVERKVRKCEEKIRRGMVSRVFPG